MDRDYIENYAKENEVEMLLYDGLDEAIIGISTRFGRSPVVAYDYQKVIEILVAQGMTHEEAIEHYGFNIIGGWNGDGTPTFIETSSD